MSIEIKHLKKSYGSQTVLDDINFSIKDGEIVAFLGENGAGKSTTMKIINGYLSKDSGEVKVCGYDVDTDLEKVHSLIGYLPEHNPIYPDMYVREYLMFIAGLYKVEDKKARVDEMIAKTGLTKESHKRIGMLSKGYRQRVGLAAALIPNPKVLILDEPTTGLDPNQIIEVRDLIKEVGKEKTVMLSTHLMQEVSAICDRVIIIKNGKIVANEAESEIVSATSDGCVVEVEFLNETDLSALQQKFADSKVRKTGDRSFSIESKADVRLSVFEYAKDTDNPLLTLKLKERSMEDVFIQLTNNAKK